MPKFVREDDRVVVDSSEGVAFWAKSNVCVSRLTQSWKTPQVRQILTSHCGSVHGVHLNGRVVRNKGKCNVLDRMELAFHLSDS